MAKFAIIKSSQLGDRWDAQFHIALDKVRDRVEALRNSMSAEEALRRLEGISLKDKQPLMVLARGGSPALTSKTIERVTREYPHLSIAIMENNTSAAVQRIREEIARNESYLAAVLEIGKPEAPPDSAGAEMEKLQFMAGHIYPLKDATRYDDEFGAGFDHIAIAAEATPGTSRVHDAWIVNAAGQVHPGYDANPIPISIDDVEISQGRALDADLPEPRNIFDSPWFGR